VNRDTGSRQFDQADMVGYVRQPLSPSDLRIGGVRAPYWSRRSTRIRSISSAHPTPRGEFPQSYTEVGCVADELGVVRLLLVPGRLGLLHVGAFFDSKGIAV